MEDKIDFLKTMLDDMCNEFWYEAYRSTIIKNIEAHFIKEITDHWCISDIVINGYKVLLKWYRKINPITE